MIKCTVCLMEVDDLLAHLREANHSLKSILDCSVDYIEDAELRAKKIVRDSNQ